MRLEAKLATTDYPVHELIAKRWSPYAFFDRPVPAADLRSLFEAARWAPSSNNEQPWSYIVATRDDKPQFDLLVSCLVEANQVWAKDVPVLALAVASLRFSRNGRDNRMAAHDLGLAAASLTFEAASRGLMVHQMAGILPERAREVYRLPEAHEAWTGLAIGYLGEDPPRLPEKLQARDAAVRQRKKLSEFVFTGELGTPEARSPHRPPRSDRHTRLVRRRGGSAWSAAHSGTGKAIHDRLAVERPDRLCRLRTAHEPPHDPVSELHLSVLQVQIHSRCPETVRSPSFGSGH